MIRTARETRFGWALILVLLVAGAVSTVAQEAPQAIPTDAKGLPLWQVKEWSDHPVSILLQDEVALEALLAAVPIASFDRDQIRPVWDDAKHFRLEFRPRVTDDEEAALISRGYAVERLPDLDRLGREGAERRWAEQYAKGGDDFVYGEKGVWHNNAQMIAILDQIETDHPGIARTFNWGTSIQGRDLYGLVISADVDYTTAEPEVRLSSTMHGDEPPMMEMLLFLADYLTDNYGQAGYDDVTYLVDNYEIHLMPLYNPDGNAMSQRYNANSVDLNRNFLEPAGTHGTLEIENVYFENYSDAHHFVISLNGHSGALVVNYPWDYTYTLAPDDAALQLLSLEFSTYNLPMYNSPYFTDGITNGAAWYVITGSLQDWSYDQTDCIDVTLEDYDTKWPSDTVIDGLWEENRESLMHFVKAARYGVHGVVTSSASGLPLDATVTVTGNAVPVHTDPAHGDYYKLLATGTFDITYEATGYISQTVYGVSTVWGTETVQDVALAPLASADLAGNVTDILDDPVAAWLEVRTHPGDSYVTSVLAGAADGAYSIELVLGDYRVIATHEGHMTQSQTVILGAGGATLDFVLGIAVEDTLIASDFESGGGDWTGGWGLATPAEGSASLNSMTDSPGTDVKYANNADTECRMAAGVDLSSAMEAELTFWAKWDIENGWDCVKLEISTDGGSGWTAIATDRTEPGSGQGAQVPASDPVFDNAQAGWLKNTVGLATWLGQADARFRFHLESDGSQTKDGFYFDDFTIIATVDGAAGVDGPPAVATRELRAYPNPFNPQTTFAYELAERGHLRLRVYDAQGRLVRTLHDGPAEAGSFVRQWDGRDQTGARVASGVYFGRAVSADGERAVKVVMVK